MESVKDDKQATLTPLMQQYLRIKDAHKDDILFFRLGDFYEMFYEDAIKASPIMEVALTKRQMVPMCGIPHHAASTYIAKLLKAGLSVAVAEQMEDPKSTKGMVKRAVVRVITPGTLVEDELLPSKANNFLVALSVSASSKPRGGQTEGNWALAAADVSTGQQWVGESKKDFHWNLLKGQLARLNPSEILIVGQEAKAVLEELEIKTVSRFEPAPSTASNLTHQVIQGIQTYLERDHPDAALSLRAPEPLPSESSGILFLDETAVRHLELIDSADPSRGGPTLIGVLDRTLTPMGSRLLRWWMLHPSLDLAVIHERLDQVEDLVSVSGHRDSLREILKEIGDLERITVRVRTGSASPRDLASLRLGLAKLPEVRNVLAYLEKDILSSHFSNLMQSLESHPLLVDILTKQLADEPAPKVSMGGVIRTGFNKDLDELRGLRHSGKKWMADLEAAEREKTGIGSLKIGYNDVFGYFLEVSKTNISKVPADWIRKQTLANAERYITPALKEQEEKLLHAEEKIFALETSLFADLLKQVSAHTVVIQRISSAVAQLDTLISLAQAAVENGYVKPRVAEGEELVIRGGRHPVIERQIGRDRFIANEVHLGTDNGRIGVITGPNMAGKSTYLRQTALIVIMAQMGSFVPAESAAIGLVDRIFTRIGASDRLSQGQSTFMVEMEEVATLLANSTKRSLLVLDEVGRGTSTYDGVSIAWAVIDYLVKQGGTPRTLFATHYFELTQLAFKLPGVFNSHATAKEWPGPDGRKQVVFLYQIMPGPADRSYGIHVAEMAGLPSDCIDRAREIMDELETGTHNLAEAPAGKVKKQLDFFGDHPVVEEIKNLRLDEMTPLEALNVLSNLKKKTQK